MKRHYYHQSPQRKDHADHVVDFLVVVERSYFDFFNVMCLRCVLCSSTSSTITNADIELQLVMNQYGWTGREEETAAIGRDVIDLL